MKHVKLFEEYDKTIHLGVGLSKKVSNSKIGKWISKWGSVLDDIVHFDFKLIPYQFKNREAFNNCEKVINEIGIIQLIYQESEKKGIDVTFEDLKKYEVDPETAKLLNDEGVQEYFSKDKKLRLRMDKLNEFVEILKDYENWYNIE